MFLPSIYNRSAVLIFTVYFAKLTLPSECASSNQQQKETHTHAHDSKRVKAVVCRQRVCFQLCFVMLSNGYNLAVSVRFCQFHTNTLICARKHMLMHTHIQCYVCRCSTYILYMPMPHATINPPWTFGVCDHLNILEHSECRNANKLFYFQKFQSVLFLFV